MEEVKKVIWLGVTPLERGSKRSRDLAEYIGGYSLDFPNTTSGMDRYNHYKGILKEWNIIATDQENIDKSWEEFYCAENWGKRIVQFKDEAWKDLHPGFSKEQSNSNTESETKEDEENVMVLMNQYYNRNPRKI